MSRFTQHIKYSITWYEYYQETYEEYDCIICMSEITNKDDWRAFPCYSTVIQKIPHCFHDSCIKSWIAINKTCPSCRGECVI